MCDSQVIEHIAQAICITDGSLSTVPTAIEVERE